MTITAVDNEIDAPDKTVTVSATARNAQAVAGPEPVTLTIADDDETPTVTLALSRSSISENGGTATVTGEAGPGVERGDRGEGERLADAAREGGRLQVERGARPDRSGGQDGKHRDGDDRGRRQRGGRARQDGVGCRRRRATRRG